MIKETKVCPWHPEYELPCPICYLRSFDSYATKMSYNPQPGKGLNNPPEGPHVRVPGETSTGDEREGAVD